MQRKKLSTTIFILLPPMIAAVFFLLRNQIISLAGCFPKCPVYELLHIQCPGCGNTRSVIALLNFDIIGSLRYNIIPITLAICCILLYTELLTWYFGKRIKILTKTTVIMYVIIAVCMLYFLLRNFFR